VSLTKHGAHKVAALLKLFDKDDVLRNLTGTVPGINIELAQARKTLATNNSGQVPNVWRKAKERGPETIDALVLIAVIFSHHQLVSAMKAGAGKRPFVGRVVRGAVIDGKAFTNFAHIIEQLGFSTEHTEDHVDFNLHRIFQIPRLGELVAELLAIKLKSAGWDGKGLVADEAVRLGIHVVFGVKAETFAEWLNKIGYAGTVVEGEAEDAEFFFAANDTPSSGKFTFRSGHAAKKTGSVAVAPSKKATTADLLHNEMQNSLVAKLQDEHGKENVGSEQPTGRGTSIDVVARVGSSFWFYEIKTDRSVRACIRQAIPQLLEYAYWSGEANTAERLIIVGPSPITKEGDKYLAFLRKQFGLEIYYELHESKGSGIARRS
jgi:hypothetical protein